MVAISAAGRHQKSRPLAINGFIRMAVTFHFPEGSAVSGLPDLVWLEDMIAFTSWATDIPLRQWITHACLPSSGVYEHFIVANNLLMLS